MTAKQFKNIRKSLGLNQVEMSVKLGVSRETISNIERSVHAPSKATAIFMENLYQSVNSPQNANSNQNIANEDGVSYTATPPRLGSSDSGTAIMVNTATSLVSLDMICEVLSVVSSQPLEEIKARANAMLQERGKKLQIVLESVF